MKSLCELHNVPKHWSAGGRRQGNYYVSRNLTGRQDVKSVFELPVGDVVIRDFLKLVSWILPMQNLQRLREGHAQVDADDVGHFRHFGQFQGVNKSGCFGCVVGWRCPWLRRTRRLPVWSSRSRLRTRKLLGSSF